MASIVPARHPTMAGVIRPRFLPTMLAWSAVWLSVVLGVVWIADPYGIAPIRIPIAGFNQLKPRRLDIDRLIKPFEVWRRQPRTIFLGTSRIHQSIDPAALDGTPLAPAYNASVPAVSLGMNESYLDLDADLDSNLSNVFLELFIYNFLGQGQNHPPISKATVAADWWDLNVSMDALLAAGQSVAANVSKAAETAEIAPEGYFKYPPNHDPSGTFSAFPWGIWDLYKRSPGGLKLSEPALGAVSNIVAASRRRQLKLVLLATPNHVYVDYYLDRVHAWPLVETWLKRVSADPTVEVYSFAQPNAWTEEPVSSHMTYWNDPFHFSLSMGRAIQASLIGRPLVGTPENFMVRVTPENAHDLVEARRQAVTAWAAGQTSFIAAMDAEYVKAFGRALP